MTSAAKAKGNGFERECAKILTDIFGEHFHRNISGSGNFIGGSNAYRKGIVSQSMINVNRGDIVCPDSFNGKMVVECKFYKDFAFHHLLINKKIPDLDKWIEQQYDIIEESDFWFIAFKINRCGSYIVVDESLCNFVDDKLGNHAFYYYNGKRFIVAEFEPFITLYKDEIIKKCS